MGCKFCATGAMKFGRNLTYEEIFDQVLYFHCKLMQQDERISNVVFMGMGEPFMNYDNVMDAVRLLNSPDGLGLAARRITVSTSGVVDAINKLTEDPLQVNLALPLPAFLGVRLENQHDCTKPLASATFFMVGTMALGAHGRRHPHQQVFYGASQIA
jgi:adenine C2-methylase RlmN of 23S rRNA A2503 and tRNA A37